MTVKIDLAKHETETRPVYHAVNHDGKRVFAVKSVPGGDVIARIAERIPALDDGTYKLLFKEGRYSTSEIGHFTIKEGEASDFQITEKALATIEALKKQPRPAPRKRNTKKEA